MSLLPTSSTMSSKGSLWLFGSLLTGLSSLSASFTSSSGTALNSRENMFSKNERPKCSKEQGKFSKNYVKKWLLWLTHVDSFPYCPGGVVSDLLKNDIMIETILGNPKQLCCHKYWQAYRSKSDSISSCSYSICGRPDSIFYDL